MRFKKTDDFFCTKLVVKKNLIWYNVVDKYF